MRRCLFVIVFDLCELYLDVFFYDFGGDVECFVVVREPFVDQCGFVFVGEFCEVVFQCQWDGFDVDVVFE